MSLIKPGGKRGLLEGRVGPEVGEIPRDKGTSPLVSEGKRTDYQKKAVYLGLRHQDTLDDLVKALRRHDLPDDRSMVVRALLDVVAVQIQGEQAESWITALAEACRHTLPGTTK